MSITGTVPPANYEIYGLLAAGLAALRPAPGIVDRFYFSTDTLILERDTGVAWVEVVRGEAAIRLAQLAERSHGSLTGVMPDQHHARDHHTRHEPGGADEVVGVVPGAHAATHLAGAGDNLENSLRLAQLSEKSHASLTNVTADQHHARQHDHSLAADGSPIAVAGVPALPASKITSGRFGMAQMPDGTSGYVLIGQGVGVDPAYTAPATGNDILKAIQQHLGVFWLNNNWLPSGMITNGVSGTGYLTWASENVVLHSGATAESYAYIEKQAYGLSFGASWAKKRYFGVSCSFLTYTLQAIHIVSGDISSYTLDTNTRNHIGFKLFGNTLFGTVANGTSESTLSLETISAPVDRRLEVIFNPGVEARFYLNGVDKGAITTNLPSGAYYSRMMLKASANNGTPADRFFYLYESRTFQEQ